MPDQDDLRARADELRKKLAALDQLTGKSNERDRDAQRKRAARAASKEVLVPACADRERRARLEADDAAWLRWYCEDLFWYDFRPQQLMMIEAIRNAILSGGDQALAASRGEGKTKNFERMLLKYSLQGIISFSILFGATGGGARDSLASIMQAIETNARLAADYPEVCIPVRALENTPNRAHYQIVTGLRHDNGEPYKAVSSKFKWCGQEIVFPNVPGSSSAGCIIATRGLDGAVRGLNKFDRRPDVVGIDDPETETSAANPDTVTKLEKKIDRAIAGLGDQQHTVARVMLTTLQNRICLSYKYTDPQQKSSWKGRRFRFLVKPPDRTDLWEEFVQLQIEDWQNEVATGKETTKAHDLYVARQQEMDAGAEVSNPYRHTAKQLSALEFYYVQVAKLGQAAVSTEYDNDPPEEAGPVESGITAYRIQRQVNGYARKVVPPTCTLLTQGIDTRKVALHWTVRAWQADCTPFTLDYGVTETRGTVTGSDDGLDLALIRALKERMEQVKESPYCRENGEAVPIMLTLVDAGWRTPAVYQACREIGLGIMPAMGFGKSAGCAQANFSEIQHRTRDRQPGFGWFLSRKDDLWLVCMDADRWKAWEHDRWMTDPGRVGAATLFGQRGETGRLSFDERNHHSYARHITAEVEVEEVVKGVLKRGWKSKTDNNHWLDASYMSNVAANICGIRLMRAVESQQQRLQPAAQEQAETIRRSDVQDAIALGRPSGGGRNRW